MTETTLVVRHTEQEIDQRVRQVAAEIMEAVGTEEVLIVGVLKGSALFLADLVRALTIPVRFEFIDVTRNDEEDDAGEAKIGIRFFRHFSVEGRNVVVLKDVVTTGVVETYLLAQLRAQAPRSLRLAAVVDRPPARRTPLEVDHALFVEVEPELWVGYGLDAGEGTSAHLRDLAVISE